MSDTATGGGSNSIADYEAFTERAVGDELWELIRGRIVMMTNPSEDHARLVSNLFAPLKAAMDEAGCRAYPGGVRVQRSSARGDDMAVIPDVVVRCGPRHGRDFVTDPLVVVEVLSRSTMHVDRGVKFDFYRSLPSLQHIVLIYQRQVRIEHFRRDGDGWLPFELVRPTDRLDLDAIDFSIALDDVYSEVPALRAVGPGGDPSDDEPILPIR